MATLYKHKTQPGLWYIAQQVRSMCLCKPYMSINYYTGETKEFTQYGKWRMKDLIPVAYD